MQYLFSKKAKSTLVGNFFVQKIICLTFLEKEYDKHNAGLRIY